MADKLTYGQLYQKLNALGYQEHTDAGNGTDQRVFRHPDFPRATIFLPVTPLEKTVSRMHLAAVHAVLSAHGVVALDPEQVFLQALDGGQARPSPSR